MLIFAQLIKKFPHLCNPKSRYSVYRRSSSSSIGTATLVGYGLLNYLWAFSAGRCLQSAVASCTSNPQLGRPV